MTSTGQGALMRTLELTEADRDAVANSVARSLVGELPSSDDRFRAVEGATEDRDDEGAFIRLMASEASAQLDGKPAEKIVAWAAGVVPRFTATSSFGAESAVLLHLLSEVAPHVPVLFLDTGFHFDETIGYRRDLAKLLGLTVLDVAPSLSVAQQAQRYGEDLYQTDPDTCCRLRKTMPLRRMLANFDGWATGVRRSQTPERASTPVVEARRHADRWLVKVAPLATWTETDVNDYIARHDLPVHPMVADGFPSIGCQPCTVRVPDGDDPRSGRWATFDDKTECGIHLASDGSIVRSTSTPG